MRTTTSDTSHPSHTSGFVSSVTGQVTRTPGDKIEARAKWIEVADDDAHPLLALRRQGHVCSYVAYFIYNYITFQSKHNQ